MFLRLWEAAESGGLAGKGPKMCFSCKFLTGTAAGGSHTLGTTDELFSGIPVSNSAASSLTHLKGI